MEKMFKQLMGLTQTKKKVPVGAAQKPVEAERPIAKPADQPPSTKQEL